MHDVPARHTDLLAHDVIHDGCLEVEILKLLLKGRHGLDKLLQVVGLHILLQALDDAGHVLIQGDRHGDRGMAAKGRNVLSKETHPGHALGRYSVLTQVSTPMMLNQALAYLSNHLHLGLGVQARHHRI